MSTAALKSSKRYNDTELEMSILSLYFDGIKIKDIAKAIGRSYEVTQVKLKRLRKKHDVPARRKSAVTMESLYEDKDIIIELSQHLSIRQLSIKFACKRELMSRFIKKHGGYGYEPSSDMPSTNLDNLKKGGWVDIEEKTILTIGRVPRFYLVPITEEEKE